jgi:predicted ATP-binding protein involved in virulence
MHAVTEKMSRVAAYDFWADASLGSSAFQGWVIAKSLERFQTSSETGRPFDEIDDDELALVNTALSVAVEGFEGMRYDMRQKSLLIDWQSDRDGVREVTRFENLSDGQRAVIGLVADIARRMCLLNPILGDEVTEKTPGVVLIDELDMHLHPRWQRILTTGLKRAFPALQFIVASHSPQVIGELHPEEIILLRPGGTDHPQVSYGLNSSQILEEIMGANARNVDVENRLTALFEQLERNQLDLAREEIARLKNDVPGLPELAGAEALLKRKQVLGR